MHDSKRMLEPGVHGSGINHVGPTELADPSQPLKHRMIDYLPLVLVQPNEPVNGVPNLVRL